MFDTNLFTSALRNSLGISLIATAISVALATVAAYAIARLEFQGKKAVLSTALAIAMFPTVALVGPLFDMWRSLGIYDTWLGLIIPYMSFTLPLAIWTLSSFFREIPWEMEQAAQVDGATPWQAFRKVIVPLAAPGCSPPPSSCSSSPGTTSCSASRSRPPTGPARPGALAFFTGESFFQQPTAAISAAAVIVTIPVMILVLVFQRKIVAGLTSGAVKG